MCYDNEYRMNKSRREKIMKKRIVFATGNAGKMKEIKMILGDLGMPVVSMKEAGIEADIVEDGTSFAENAQIKASAVFEKCHDIVLADDSGLEIDYLNKEPGIYSAYGRRYFLYQKCKSDQPSGRGCRMRNVPHVLSVRLQPGSSK